MDRAGVTQQQCALAEVVQQQCRPHEQQPAAGDRLTTKVSEIGIQRLATRDTQKYGAKDGERHERMSVQQLECITWINGDQHFRGLQDGVDAERGEDDEPRHHDRTKGATDACRAVLLNHEQGEQNSEGERYDNRLEGGRQKFKAFHGAQHRDGGGDDPVAKKQRTTDESHDRQRSCDLKVGACQRQLREGENAAFTVVVGS